MTLSISNAHPTNATSMALTSLRNVSRAGTMDFSHNVGLPTTTVIEKQPRPLLLNKVS